MFQDKMPESIANQITHKEKVKSKALMSCSEIKLPIPAPMDTKKPSLITFSREVSRVQHQDNKDKDRMLLKLSMPLQVVILKI